MQPNAPVTAVDAMFVALEHALGCRQSLVHQLAALATARGEVLATNASQPDQNPGDRLANIESLLDELQTELGKLDAVLIREFPNVERVFLDNYGHRLSLFWTASAIVQLATMPVAPAQPMETVQ